MHINARSVSMSMLRFSILVLMGFLARPAPTLGQEDSLRSVVGSISNDRDLRVEQREQQALVTGPLLFSDSTSLTVSMHDGAAHRVPFADVERLWEQQGHSGGSQGLLLGAAIGGVGAGALGAWMFGDVNRDAGAIVLGLPGAVIGGLFGYLHDREPRWNLLWRAERNSMAISVPIR